MLKRVRLENLDDYFIELGKRKNRGVYFYRINGYNRQIHAFVHKYYESARLSGVIIEGKLKNPEPHNLAYYNEIMGKSFQLSMGFITSSLQKWIPRMNTLQRENVAGSIYDTLMTLKRKGKTEDMLKNTYIKFMCWLYYKFERIVNRLGENSLPKILYEGNIGMYELLLMNVLAIAGCDIVLLQYQGDANYLKIDSDSSMSDALDMNGTTAFPKTFSLEMIRQEIQEKLNNERLYGVKPERVNCTNAWISGKVFDVIRTNVSARGTDERFYYNCLIRISGVEDKLTYQNELYQLQLELKNCKRRIVIVNGEIAVPTMEEIDSIRRNNYQNINQLIMDLSTNISSQGNQELQRIMKKAFVDILMRENKMTSTNISRLTNKAVYLLCWLKRYQHQLFANWKKPEISCFFYMGGCKNDNEAMFCRFLALLPVDVVIFNPNLNKRCCLNDEWLYEVQYENSLAVEKYPEENSGLRIGTGAYHAERELDELMYHDSGLYRNQQYQKANAVVLQTMYEEIPILWKTELKYRTNFSTVGDVVNIPVIFSKVSGVKNADTVMYWRQIRELIDSDTTVIKTVPNITSTSINLVKPYATEFFRNGKLQRSKIKSHKSYQYGNLRDSMQDYLLDKMQQLIERRLIKGTFENGTEYTIVSTALNLDSNILRMIQKFDFTKKNPKLIYIITGEKKISLEDTIQAAFLNMVGFDIVFFVPTGYQCIEGYFKEKIIEEHQLGEYMFDLSIPSLDSITSEARLGWCKNIFKRGR